MSQFIEMFGNPLFNTKKWRWYSNINNVVTIVLGSTPNTKEPKYWDGDIKWITPAEMDDETFMINDTLRHITEFGVKSANLTKLPVGSVLFSTRAPIGKVGIAAAEMYCNQGFKSFICSNQVDSIFLYYTLKLNKEYLCSLGTGTTFKELSKKTVEGLKLGVPPIDLQKQFAIIYKQADKSKFGDFKSQFIEMFKNSEKIALGNMATFVNGSAFKPDDWSTEGVPIVRIQNLTQDDSTYNYYNGDMTKKVIIDSGDIIISWSATLGVFFWNRGRALLNQHIFKVLFNKVNVNKEFFVYTVRLALDEMADIAHGSTMRHIVKKDFDGTMVAYPDYEEQERFASIVKQADKSKSYVRIAFKNLESMLGYCIRQIS